MKNTKLKRSGFTAFLTGKGFYIAICLSIAVVIATAYFVVHTTRNQLTEQNESNISLNAPNNEWGYSDLQADASQSDVPKEESSEKQPSKENTSENNPPKDQQAAAKPEKSEPSSESDRVFSNAFVLPLKGEVITEFSDGKPVKSETMNDWRTHDGVDIKAPIATPVKASSDGIVASIEQDPMWGVTITIDHGNGYQTMYMGLNVNVSVKKGETVEIGTVLGSVGETASIESAMEPHLHFAMKKDGKWIDPMEKMQNL